jgi:uncharacterized delta-60 repeat protein
MKKLMLLLLVIAVLVAPACAIAGAGTLDRSFGQHGKVVRSLRLQAKAWDAAPTSIAKLPGGRTVVLAGTVLAGLRADGTPDQEFGTVRVNGPAGATLELTDVVPDSSGRVLVAGTALVEKEGFPAGDLFLARYRADGSLDPSFGEGGVLVTDVGLAPPRTLDPPTGSEARTRLGAIAVDAAGRIVLDGVRISAIGPCRGNAVWAYYEGFAARLTSGGALDPTFAENGVAHFPGVERMDSLALTRAGGVYLSGIAWSGCSPTSDPRELIALDAAGLPVPTFGAGGEVRLPDDSPYRDSSIALDRSGRILLLSQRYLPRSAGARGRLIALVRRIAPSGRLDLSFGHGGAGILAAGPRDSFTSAAIALARTGKIVLAGTTWRVRSGGNPRAFMVGRLTAEGTLDRSFGQRGRLATRFGKRAQARGTSLAVLSGERLLVAGTISRPSLAAGEGLALVRYLGR